MAVWVITGELGSGKSLQAVAKIRDFLERGCRVATNMDLRLEKLVSKRKRADVTRLPDWPTSADLDALGKGYEGPFDEKRFGVIVLDEAAVFLNSRDWQGKDRTAVIAWLRHARKLRWHLILLSQDIESLDKQVRVALAEHVVRCRRGDRLTVPVFSFFTKMLGLGPIRLPQIHIGVVRYGSGAHAPVVDRWFLPDARALWGAYDTQQVILGDGPAYTALDGSKAPWLWPPGGIYDWFWQRWGWKWGFAPSTARRRHDDFRLWESVYSTRSPSQPAALPYAEWITRQAGHPGPLGAAHQGGGEAGEPDAPPLAQAA